MARGRTGIELIRRTLERVRAGGTRRIVIRRVVRGTRRWDVRGRHGRLGRSKGGVGVAPWAFSSMRWGGCSCKSGGCVRSEVAIVRRRVIVVVHRQRPPRMGMRGVPAVQESFRHAHTGEARSRGDRKRWRESDLGFKLRGLETMTPPRGGITGGVTNVNALRHPEPWHSFDVNC